MDRKSSMNWIGNQAGHQAGTGWDIKQEMDRTSRRDWMGYQAGAG